MFEKIKYFLFNSIKKNDDLFSDCADAALLVHMSAKQLGVDRLECVLEKWDEKPERNFKSIESYMFLPFQKDVFSLFYSELAKQFCKNENDGFLEQMMKNFESRFNKKMYTEMVSEILIDIAKNDNPVIFEMFFRNYVLPLGIDKKMPELLADCAMKLCGEETAQTLKLIRSLNKTGTSLWKTKDNYCLKIACVYGNQEAVDFLVRDNSFYSLKEIEAMDFLIVKSARTLNFRSPLISKEDVQKIAIEREEVNNLHELVKTPPKEAVPQKRRNVI